MPAYNSKEVDESILKNSFLSTHFNTIHNSQQLEIKKCMNIKEGKFSIHRHFPYMHVHLYEMHINAYKCTLKNLLPFVTT